MTVIVDATAGTEPGRSPTQAPEPGKLARVRGRIWTVAVFPPDVQAEFLSTAARAVNDPAEPDAVRCGPAATPMERTPLERPPSGGTIGDDWVEPLVRSLVEPARTRLVVEDVGSSCARSSNAPRPPFHVSS